ncbi:MAG: cytosine permease [Nitrososphaerota archaeon]|nr:cytosine permease [Nitrososphaerota archaeon]MDG6979398.1 cytosine permease [Nitrososphaerota archaeon]
MERLGIEHVEEERRHGLPFSAFTLWFGANLTIADFALGSLFFGLPLSSVAVAIVLGNILGGVLVGLMAAMGPTFGYPQMMISRAVMGRSGNVPFALANWVSTVGWFTVNIILGGYAIELAFGLPFYAAAAVMVVVDIALATYGHDIIHAFEKAMSVVLGVMFGAIALMAYLKAGTGFAAYEAGASFDAYFWVLVVAVVFSYLMSWSPYASDYSRYLPRGASKLRVVAFTAAGGAVASAWAEVAGFFVYVAANNTHLNAVAALAQVSGGYSVFALMAIVLGAVAADALNLYTNSLSALVLYGKAGRARTVLVAGGVGFALALAASSSFGSFYQNFLLTLDYWITPWIGVMVAAFFVKKVRSGVEGAPPFVASGLGAYALGMLASVPFMNLSSYGVSYVGPVASLMGGADVSYFVGAIVAFLAYSAIAIRQKT